MTDSLSSASVRRAAAVAADYEALQGLINVSTGLGLAVVVLGQPALGAVVIGLGTAFGSLWYRRRFGRAPARRSTAAVLGCVLAGAFVLLAALALDNLLDWPVLFFPLASAGFLAAAYRLGYARFGVTRWHWAVAGLVALCSLLPLLGVGRTSAGSTWVLLFAAALVVIGAIDHVRLVRAMRPVPRD